MSGEVVAPEQYPGDHYIAKLVDEIEELEAQQAALVAALEAVFEVFDGDYGHGISNGYWADYKPIHEQAKQALAAVAGESAK